MKICVKISPLREKVKTQVNENSVTNLFTLKSFTKNIHTEDLRKWKIVCCNVKLSKSK